MSKTLVTSADHRDWWGCPCLAAWWPLVTQLAVARGIVRKTLDVTQGGYNRDGVAASAGTHDGGGVLDLVQVSDATIRLLREAGAAAWHRTPAQGFIHHTHMVLVGCPHVSSGAAHQVAEYRAGRNGLAGRGRDDGPRVTIRTWREGITWMQSQLGVPAAAGGTTTPSGTTTTQEEDDMAHIESISPKAAEVLGDAIARHIISKAKGDRLIVHSALESVSDAAAKKIGRNAKPDTAPAPKGDAR